MTGSSESEGESSQDDWIQDDEDAESIGDNWIQAHEDAESVGDEELEIYGDDFDSDDDNDALLSNALLTSTSGVQRPPETLPDRELSGGPRSSQNQGQHREPVEPLKTVTAEGQHQSPSFRPQRRSRPSDTQRARPSDTRRKTPTRPGSIHIPTSNTIGPVADNAKESESAEIDVQERQVFRGVSHDTPFSDTEKHPLEQVAQAGSAKWERANLLKIDDDEVLSTVLEGRTGESVADGRRAEPEKVRRESRSVPLAADSLSVREGIKIEIPSKIEDLKDWGLVTSLHPSRPPSSLREVEVQHQSIQPNWLERVSSHGNSSQNSDQEDWSFDSSMEPVPLKLTASHNTFSLSPTGQYGLSPMHRNRINNFLGITEWPPKPVVVEVESPPVAPFIQTVYDIVSDPQNWYCVQWGQNGASLLIKDPKSFDFKIVPRYFTGTWKSRNGQLNGTGYDLAQVLRTLRVYGFTKVDPDDPDRMEFVQRWFRQTGEHLHRLVPRTGTRSMSAKQPFAHNMLLPRPWTPLSPRAKRPMTAGAAVAQSPELKPHPPSRAQSAKSRASDPARTSSVAGPEVTVAHDNNSIADGHASGTFLGAKRSKFHYLRREQMRKESAKAEETVRLGGRLASVVQQAAAAALRRGPSGGLHKSPLPARAQSLGRGASLRSAGSRSPRSHGGQSPARSVQTRSPSLGRRTASGSPAQLARSKSMLAARRRQSNEVLVGFDLGVHGEAGMRVKWSEEGVEHKMQDGTLPGLWVQAVGVITEVESDGRMCLVQWQSGGEEWCCTGFSDKHYLQQFVVKHFEKPASTWRKEARLAPQWQFANRDGVWRMNRLKSQLKVNMQAIKWEADADKLLPTVKSMVAKHFHQQRVEHHRQQEEHKVKLKMQRRQERRGKHPHRDGANGAMCGMDETEAVPDIDNVQGVGEFVRSHGPMERIVQVGLLSQLGKVLRKAYDDMDQQPSGNLKHKEVLMAVQRMGLGIAPPHLAEILKQHDRERSGEVTLDEFLDSMYHVLQRRAETQIQN